MPSRANAKAPVKPGTNRPKGLFRKTFALLAIFAGVGGTVFVIESTNQKVEYLIAKSDLPPGHIIAEEDLTAVAVNLGAVADQYVALGESISGSQVQLTIRAKSLIAKTSVGQVFPQAGIPIVVQPSVMPPENISVGSLVDIWATESFGGAVSETPSPISLSATVLRIFNSESAFAKDLPSLEIRVPLNDIPGVLQALAAGSHLAVLEHPVGVG